jgi:poly-gamma-glutamate capsule biosynthesis protein CapA/YwtB (metallophosphatase superfamily)
MTSRGLQRFIAFGIISFCVGGGLGYAERMGRSDRSAQTPGSDSLQSSAIASIPSQPVSLIEPVTSKPVTAKLPAPPTPAKAAAPQSSVPKSSPSPATPTPQPTPKPTPTVKPNPVPKGTSITIKAVGDVIPGTNYPDYRLPDDANTLLPDPIRAYLKSADLTFGNFESSLTTYPYSSKDVSRGQVFAFRSPPEYAQLFSKSGFDVFNIANNHAMDFGESGLKDTIANLAGAGVKTVGQKNQILAMEVKGVRVAIVGFSPYDYYNSVQDLATAKSLIAKAKEQAEIVIVSMHAGAEGTDALHVADRTEFFFGENRGNSVSFARTAIDAGADLVLGHGPHVPRAIELYQGKLIAYSLGNFLGYRTLSTSAQAGYSLILEVKLDAEGNFASGKVIPVVMDERGIPQVDSYFRTVGLLRHLIESDFPNTALEIDRQGQISVSKKPGTAGKE